MQPEPKILYDLLCPVCGSAAENTEILEKGACNKHELSYSELLKKHLCQTIPATHDICELEVRLDHFIKFAKDALKAEPFRLLKYWVKRALNHESFAILAPTGLGKTTFGILYSLFTIRKTYYIVPTRVLVKQVAERLTKYNRVGKKILGVLTKQDKQALLNHPENIDILVTTTAFMHKNFDKLPRDFQFIFIDDADSLLRQASNIEKVLMLAGFSIDDIDLAKKIIKLKAYGKFDLAEKLKRKIKRKNTQIISASATFVPKTNKIKLFRELLNFELGSTNTTLRNIIDLYKITQDPYKETARIVKKLNSGTIVFVSEPYDFDKTVEVLKTNNIAVLTYDEFENKLEQFENGEYAAVVTKANPKNPLVRGVNLPEVIKHAVFVGTPILRVPLEVTLSPKRLLFLASVLTRARVLALKDYLKLRKQLEPYLNLSKTFVENNPTLRKKIEPVADLISTLLKQTDCTLPTFPFPCVKKDQRRFALIPDTKTYIQASGRTSRLSPFGLTLGLSCIIDTSEKPISLLLEHLRKTGLAAEFKDMSTLSEEKLNNILEKILKEREKLKKQTKAKHLPDLVETVLVIVESPTKAKTLAGFFSKPAKKQYGNIYAYEASLGNKTFIITASAGHITDLKHNPGYYGTLLKPELIPWFCPIKMCAKCGRKVDTETTVCPICGSKRFLTKKDIIDELRLLAYYTDSVYITTDPDTEGEKIAYDLKLYLHPLNPNVKRMELHEITPSEFLKQLQNLRDTDTTKVAGQLTRRIADRWVGFALSEKLQEQFKEKNLSAGRVQTPVLGLIIQRFEQTKQKYPQLEIKLQDQILQYWLEDNPNEPIKEVEIKVVGVSQKEQAPPPPFSTAELLKEAFRRLRFPSSKTMELAQDLFEQGYITYHRTDSTYVSKAGRNLAIQLIKLAGRGARAAPRPFGTPGTHECIRPTKPLLSHELPLSSQHIKLYNLILQRFITSQAQKAKIKKAKIQVYYNNQKLAEDEVTVEVIDPGFYAIGYLKPKPITALNDQKTIKAPASLNYKPRYKPYTYAQIIEKMQELGLGRPSTYAIIIKTLLTRGYIIDRKGRLIPTKKGITTFSYLEKHYPDLISVDFTAWLETQMDKANYPDALFTLLEKLKSYGLAQKA